MTRREHFAMQEGLKARLERGDQPTVSGYDKRPSSPDRDLAVAWETGWRLAHSALKPIEDVMEFAREAKAYELSQEMAAELKAANKERRASAKRKDGNYE